MEITTELLKTIYDRVTEVFLAKTGEQLSNITLNDDGSFHCVKNHFGAYGSEWTTEEIIEAGDLTANLDEMVKIRKEKEKIEREENEKIQKINTERYNKQQKDKRKADYDKLKKEFENK